MKCDYCDIIERTSRAEILFEDEEIIVAIKDLAITPGHLVAFPRVHCTILEMMSHDLLSKCMIASTKVSTAVFEGLGSQGTNVLIQNGLGADQKVPHFGIEIVPRLEKDGVALQWEGKPLPEDEMDRLFTQISKDAAAFIKEGLKQKPVVNSERTVREVDDFLENETGEKNSKHGHSEKKKEKETNYLIKSLRRIP
ncbi:HIT family protein [Candidatus Woesearchaeota archaeon]|nr:HIT family protein [Candidatus Woesearchaeota archaeon]